MVSELATNAIQASPGANYGIRVSLDDDRCVVLRVTSASERGRPPPRGAWGPATAFAIRGRGLMIVGELSDHVDVQQAGEGTVVVTATFRPTTPERGD